VLTGSNLENAYKLVDDGLEAYEAQNYKEAFALFSEASQKYNYSVATHYVGAMYYAGLGVDKNLNLAIELFTDAANNNMPDSHYNLGLLYYNGEGVERSFEKAEYHMLAIADKDSRAQFSLAQMYREQGKGAEAFELYMKAALGGNEQAPNEIAYYYFSGEAGVEQSLVEAFAWISVAANICPTEGTMKNGAEVQSHLSEEEMQEARNKFETYMSYFIKAEGEKP